VKVVDSVIDTVWFQNFNVTSGDHVVMSLLDGVYTPPPPPVVDAVYTATDVVLASAKNFLGDFYNWSLQPQENNNNKLLVVNHHALYTATGITTESFDKDITVTVDGSDVTLDHTNTYRIMFDINSAYYYVWYVKVVDSVIESVWYRNYYVTDGDYVVMSLSDGIYTPPPPPVVDAVFTATDVVLASAKNFFGVYYDWSIKPNENNNNKLLVVNHNEFFTATGITTESFDKDILITIDDSDVTLDHTNTYRVKFDISATYFYVWYVKVVDSVIDTLWYQGFNVTLGDHVVMDLSYGEHSNFTATDVTLVEGMNFDGDYYNWSIKPNSENSKLTIENNNGFTVDDSILVESFNNDISILVGAVVDGETVTSEVILDNTNTYRVQLVISTEYASYSYVWFVQIVDSKVVSLWYQNFSGTDAHTSVTLVAPPPPPDAVFTETDVVLASAKNFAGDYYNWSIKPNGNDTNKLLVVNHDGFDTAGITTESFDKDVIITVGGSNVTLDHTNTYRIMFDINATYYYVWYVKVIDSVIDTVWFQGFNVTGADHVVMSLSEGEYTNFSETDVVLASAKNFFSGNFNWSIKPNGDDTNKLLVVNENDSFTATGITTESFDKDITVTVGGSDVTLDHTNTYRIMFDINAYYYYVWYVKVVDSVIESVWFQNYNVTSGDHFVVTLETGVYTPPVVDAVFTATDVVLASAKNFFGDYFNWSIKPNGDDTNKLLVVNHDEDYTATGITTESFDKDITVTVGGSDVTLDHTNTYRIMFDIDATFYYVWYVKVVDSVIESVWFQNYNVSGHVVMSLSDGVYTPPGSTSTKAKLVFGARMRSMNETDDETTVINLRIDDLNVEQNLLNGVFIKNDNEFNVDENKKLISINPSGIQNYESLTPRNEDNSIKELLDNAEYGPTGEFIITHIRDVYPGDNTYELINSSNTVILEKDNDEATENIKSWKDSVSIDETVILEDGTYSFKMFDSYGDGWNGGEVKVARGPFSMTFYCIGSASVDTFTIENGMFKMPDATENYGYALLIPVRDLTYMDCLSESAGGPNAPVMIEAITGWNELTKKEFTKIRVDETVEMTSPGTVLKHRLSKGIHYSDPGVFNYALGNLFSGCLDEYLVNKIEMEKYAADSATGWAEYKTMDTILNEWMQDVDVKYFYPGPADLEENGDIKEGLVRPGHEKQYKEYLSDPSNPLVAKRSQEGNYYVTGLRPKQTHPEETGPFAIIDMYSEEYPGIPAGIPTNTSYGMMSVRDFAVLQAIMTNGGLVHLENGSSVRVLKSSSVNAVLHSFNPGFKKRTESVLSEYGITPGSNLLDTTDGQKDLGMQFSCGQGKYPKSHNETGEYQWLFDKYLSGCSKKPNMQGWGGYYGTKNIIYPDSRAAVFQSSTGTGETNTLLDWHPEWSSSLTRAVCESIAGL